MNEPPEFFDDTLRARWTTVAPEALTLVRDPRSTVSPEASDRNDDGLEKFDALRALGTSTQAKSFVLERTLGEGGMGIVRLATQAVLERKVAVKTLREETRTSRRATLDLLREAWITGNLEHPNIVPVYDVGADEHGGPLVVLKRIEGTVWSAIMHDGAAIEARFGVADALEWNLGILRHVVNALAFAHSRGIVHRDVKPENVMVGRFGEVYLLDWGLAVSTREDEARLPRAKDAKHMAGTPCYMAPEMLGGQAEKIGPASDVYLLGATLFEILAGAPPHDGSNIQAIVASVILSEPAVPHHVSPEAARICKRAMAREPYDRFATVEDLRAALDAFLQHRGSRLLAERADERRRALEAALDLHAPEGELYDLLGECRFGYRAALASWEGNAEAREGLARAIAAMIDHELSRGEPGAAARLLRELSDVPDELAKRVAEAERERSVEAERVETLKRDVDPGPGARTRSFVAVVMGTLWVGLPLHGYLRASPPTVGDALAALVVLTFAYVGFFWWARESFMRTLLNQRISSSLLAVLLGHAVIGVATAFAHQSAEAMWPSYPVVWATMLAAVSIWCEPRLWPSTLMAMGLAAFAITNPTQALLGFAVFNAAFVVNVVWAWWPRGDLARAELRLRNLHARSRRGGGGE